MGLKPGKLALLWVKLNSANMCLLIIDEVSTIDSRIIALLDFRLKQLLENELPFGGMPVLFTGDFNQLGPVCKTFLPRDMITWAMRLEKHNDPVTPPMASSARSTSTMPVRASDAEMRKKCCLG